MGMFDKPKYLTGKEDAFAQPGDVFWLHNARLDGEATVAGERRAQMKLLVSHEKDGEQIIVFTSGTGIVGQLRRMDQTDRAAMPIEVRLDQVPSGKGNPTNVLNPASASPPSEVDDDDPADF